MKLHSIFKLNAASVLSALAVVALSAAVLGSTPVHAQTGGPVTLQCQVSTNGTGYALACNGTIPGGSGVLHCQSPNAISDNQGVFTAAPVACTGTANLPLTTIPGTLSTTALVIDTKNGAASIDQGSATLTVNQGLSTLTGTCQGAALSASLSPPTASVPNGTCSVTLNVLGVGNATLTIQNGSISLVDGSTLSINSPGITLTTALLGAPVTSASCDNSIQISLSQLPSISGLLALCKGS
jgi:hypothetical protein